MKYPMKFDGNYTNTTWAGYKFKELLGYTSGRHTGVDWNYGSGNTDLGFPVVAIASGKVVGRINSGTISGFGNAIIIETNGCPPNVSGTKLYHRYMHFSSVSVVVGQVVTEGQQIGTCGKTGGTDWAHLHLDTWTNRNGLGVHWNYDKDTQLASYEDPYWLITNNPNWNGATMLATAANLDQAYLSVLRRPRGAGEGDNVYLNKDLGWVYTDLSNSQEKKNMEAREAAEDKLRVELAAQVQTLSKRVDELSQQIVVLTGQLNDKQTEINALQDLNAALTKENEALKAQLAQSGSDTIHLNALGEILNWFITRLGLRK